MQGRNAFAHLPGTLLIIYAIQAENSHSPSYKAALMSTSDPTTLPSRRPLVEGPAAKGAVIAGIGLMLLGIFSYSLNDVMGKWLVATYTVPQVMLIRGFAALLLLMPFLWREGLSGIRGVQRPGLQILRGIAVIFDVACFYWAVGYLPLASVMTYYLAGPIYVTALSALLLGEKVGWRRWLAVAFGFGGVVIALDPTAGTFGFPDFVAFCGSMGFAFLMITTRQLRGTSETLLVSAQVIAPLLVGAVLAPIGWVTPSAIDFGLLGLLGIVSMIASLCVNRALKLAPASVVVPYQYTFIIWAIVFGYVFFNDTPTPHMLVGAAIIIGAGLFIFLREQALAREPVNPDRV